MKGKLKEIRYRECPELRLDENNKSLQGYAAMFNVETDIGEFEEMLAPGAFTKTIQEADVRCLWNHNSDIVLGRTKSGTLSLEEDETGLKIICHPSQTSTIVQDCVDAIERGDVSQMSFGFYTIKDSWTKSKLTNKPLRIITECALFDVSPVTFPAYSETKINLRALLQNTGKKLTDIEYILNKDIMLETVTEENHEPLQAEHSEDSNEGKPSKKTTHSPLSLRKQQIEILEIENEEHTRTKW